MKQRMLPQYAVFAIVHCLIFMGIVWLFMPNMDIDMFENFAWGQTLEWGTFKHPPLFAWITRAWFALFPTTHWAYFALSYSNLAVALMGICALTSLLLRQSGVVYTEDQRQRLLFLVIGYSILGLPFNVYAAIFNADSVLLSLWPWTAFVFLKALEPRASLGWSGLVGVLAGACVLGKYFSLVFLAGLAAISLTNSAYRVWYKTAAPYLAFLVFALVISPHVWWEYRQHAPFQEYYQHYSGSGTKKLISHQVTFLLTFFYFFILPWVLWAFMWLRKPGRQLMPSRMLLLLCWLPAIVTLVLSVIGGIHLMDRWAIPLWFTVPIWMANHTHFNHAPRVLALGWVLMLGVVAGLVLYSQWGSYEYLAKHHDYLEARFELSQRIDARFSQRFPGHQLAWAGGSIWPDHAAPLSFYLAHHPRAVPGFPDERPALVAPVSDWQSKYGVLICGKKYADSEAVVTGCASNVRAWLNVHQIPVIEERIYFKARGFRWNYLHAPEKHVTVFWVPPKSPRPELEG